MKIIMLCLALYGGMDGVRRIIRDEVLILSDKDIAFGCTAFNLKKEEFKCYIRKPIVKYKSEKYKTLNCM